MADKPRKCNYGALKADAYLMYLIQQHTKLPTSNILGFFNDLGKRVTDIGWDYMCSHKTRSMYKEIHDFFPGTDIPFMLYVEGNKYDNGTELNLSSHMHAGFPDRPTYIKTQELDNIIMEKALLGGSDMPPFEKPEPKTPKLYRELMREIRQKRMTVDED